ncbi:MAG: hypothetical protein R3B93_27190 [Bacteroidia bacterium]
MLTIINKLLKSSDRGITWAEISLIQLRQMNQKTSWVYLRLTNKVRWRSNYHAINISQLPGASNDLGQIIYDYHSDL